MSENKIYNGIMQGLQEAIAYNKGDLTTAHTRVHSVVKPITVNVYNPTDVMRMRKKLNLSQRGLAITIGVSPRTVESWEAGKSTPSGVATKLLHLIDSDNSLVDRLILRG